MSLKEYDRKRDFNKTSEPKAKLEAKSKHRFVIQKHAASHLHYDFRLEMDGTLKSWAVPKGVPYKKGEKRLAMEVEDHPVAYINFEGTIPKGQYGGGTVMVWDYGTFEPLSENPSKELKSGKLHVILKGKKLNGEWYLVRIRKDNQWLLIKGGSDAKPTSKKAEDTSAVSGKSMEQISKGKKVWNSNREETKAVATKPQVKKKKVDKELPVINVSKARASKGSSKDVPVTNRDKVFYPKTGFTKGDVIDYYTEISPILLPHLKNRPITLKRYPNGVDGMFFYEKQVPSHKPDWIVTTQVPRSDGTQIDYLLINDLNSLIWAANLADLELHTFLHRAPAIDRPTALAFDLDPGPPADIKKCCEVAMWLKDFFDSLSLECFAKTSGSKGLQVYVPLNTAVTYDQTKQFAHSLAIGLEKERPSTVVEKMKKELRRGKVLVDWSQNDEHKTTVNVYSLRAKETPTVSTPVTWAEVASASKKKISSSLVFQTKDVIKRLDKYGDLFEPVLTLKQKLPKSN